MSAEVHTLRAQLTDLKSQIQFSSFNLIERFIPLICLPSLLPRSSLESSCDSLQAAVAGLSELVWSLSTSARLTFVHELSGLDIIMELFKGSQDPIVLKESLEMVKSLGSSQTNMIDECVQAGAATEMVRLLK